MFKIRLMGLMLFVTAVLLALVAAATKTSHVTVSPEWAMWPHSQTGEPAPSMTPQPIDRSTHPPVASRAVPILWPLLALAAAGLMLWFIQPNKSPHATAKVRTKRRR